MGGVSTALAFIGPMVAGQLEQFAFGNRKRTELSAGERAGQSVLSVGLTTASTAFSLGAQFGAPGIAVAALSTAAITAGAAINSLSLSTEELIELNEQVAQQNQENITNGSAYIQAQKELNDLIKSGASSSEIETASKKVRDTFNEIADTDLQKAFSESGDNVKSLSEKLQLFTDSYLKTQSVAGLGTLLETSRPFFSAPEDLSSQLEKVDVNALGRLMMGSGINLESLRDIALEGSQRSKSITDLFERASKQGAIGGSLADTQIQGVSESMLRYMRQRGVQVSGDRDLTGGMKEFEKDFRGDIEKVIEDSGLKKGTETFKASYDFLVKLLFSEKGLGLLNEIAEKEEDFNIKKLVDQFKAKNNKVATETFNNIFTTICTI